MDGSSDQGMGRGRQARAVVLGLVFVGLCAAPHLRRLGHPSIAYDDVPRIAQLQTEPLSRLLFRPFNEHMAPWFELVSWVSWQAAGRNLTAAPVAFTAASYLAFMAAAGAFFGLARRELGAATAMLATALLVLSPWVCEAAIWYSASSFLWSLAAASGCLWLTIRAREERRPGAAVGAALLAFLAPCGSAIGLLAAPAAVVLGWPESSHRRQLRGWLSVMGPIAGVIGYLILMSVFRYQDVLTESVTREADLLTSLGSVARGPWVLVAQGFLGIDRAGRVLPAGVQMLGMAVLVGLVALAIRRGAPWRWMLAGLVWIVAGYAITFGVRAKLLGLDMMLHTPRYHLFPAAGLAMIVAGALRGPLAHGPALREFRYGGVSVALAATLVLALWNGPEIRRWAEYAKFRDQPATLAAIERLGEVGQELGVTRDQLQAQLDPVLPDWGNYEINVLAMVPPTVVVPRMADDEVRARVVVALGADERAALFGGVDGSRYLESRPRNEVPAARMTVARGMRWAGQGRFESAGWRAHLEFEPVDGESGRVRLPWLRSGQAYQVWWRRGVERWTSRQSLTIPAPRAREGSERVVDLAQLPQWEGPGAGPVSFRLVFPRPGVVEVGQGDGEWAEFAARSTTTRR